MTVVVVLQLVVGLAVLVYGADALVRGAGSLGRRAGISPLIIGLTIVAFGTSAPELAVSLQACLAGSSGVAVGNVIGSNICNVLLVLGAASLVMPLGVDRQLLRLDVPLMVLLSGLVFLLAGDLALSRGDGLLLVLLLLAYLVFTVRYGGSDPALTEDLPEPEGSVAKDLVALVAGLALLVVGSRWLVSAATTIATAMGVSELIIGLTIVAGGTSLPEVATSVVAALRGEREMSIGNVVGSNIFNLLAVLGLTGAIAPMGIPVPAEALNFDFPVMLATAVACLPVFRSGHTIHRWEGGLFLGYYVAYVLYLVLDAANHDHLPTFSLVMAAFVIPLTLVPHTLMTIRWARRKAAARATRHAEE